MIIKKNLDWLSDTKSSRFFYFLFFFSKEKYIRKFSIFLTLPPNSNSSEN